MTPKKFNALLLSLDACEDAVLWAKGKSWKKVFETCHRGDWLLWLFVRTSPDDIRLRVLVAGHCANTVRHLMKDKRSLEAVDMAIRFGEGKATKGELDAAAWSATAAAANHKQNQKLTADICRKYLPIKIWNIK
jgi:hypothetical protein